MIEGIIVEILIGIIVVIMLLVVVLIILYFANKLLFNIPEELLFLGKDKAYVNFAKALYEQKCKTGNEELELLRSLNTFKELLSVKFKS